MVETAQFRTLNPVQLYDTETSRDERRGGTKRLNCSLTAVIHKKKTKVWYVICSAFSGNARLG